MCDVEYDLCPYEAESVFQCFFMFSNQNILIWIICSIKTVSVFLLSFKLTLDINTSLLGPRESSMFCDPPTGDISLGCASRPVNKCLSTNILKMSSNSISRGDFDAAVKKVLECFAGITTLKKHQDNALFKLIYRHDVFALLPTALVNRLSFNCFHHCVWELNSMGYNSFPEKCVVIVICPLL